MCKMKKPKLPQVSINYMLEQYEQLRIQSGTIKKQMEDLSTKIKSYAEANGEKDDRGSFYGETEDFMYGKTIRQSISFDKEAAVRFFDDKGFKGAYKEVTDYVINEAEVEKLISAGKISLDDLEDITETKTSYSVLVKRKEAVPEAEEKTLAAASVKKSLFRKKGDK